MMRKILLALSGSALALTMAACATNPSVAEGPNSLVCLKWDNGVCVSTHRVKGDAPYQVGYAFTPTYAYTPVTALPQPVVTYYKLGPDHRYVYSNGYVYEVDPTTNAVVQVIDTYSH